MDQVSRPVKRVVELLVAGQYDSLEALTHSRRLGAQEIRAAVDGYGRRLVAVPDEALDDLDMIPVQGQPHSTWSVILPLWTAEEGRSDLSLELTVIEAPGEIAVEVDNIHVP